MRRMWRDTFGAAGLALALAAAAGAGPLAECYDFADHRGNDEEKIIFMQLGIKDLVKKLLGGDKYDEILHEADDHIRDAADPQVPAQVARDKYIAELQRIANGQGEADKPDTLGGDDLEFESVMIADGDKEEDTVGGFNGGRDERIEDQVLQRIAEQFNYKTCSDVDGDRLRDKLKEGRGDITREAKDAARDYAHLKFSRLLAGELARVVGLMRTVCPVWGCEQIGPLDVEARKAFEEEYRKKVCPAVTEEEQEVLEYSGNCQNMGPFQPCAATAVPPTSTSSAPANLGAFLSNYPYCVTPDDLQEGGDCPRYNCLDLLGITSAQVTEANLNQKIDECVAKLREQEANGNPVPPAAGPTGPTGTPGATGPSGPSGPTAPTGPTREPTPGAVYTIKAGDTLGEIAADLAASFGPPPPPPPVWPNGGPNALVTTLANFNCNDNPNLIIAGALLEIPDEATLRSGVPGPTNCN